MPEQLNESSSLKGECRRKKIQGKVKGQGNSLVGQEWKHNSRPSEGTQRYKGLTSQSFKRKTFSEEIYVLLNIKFLLTKFSNIDVNKNIKKFTLYLFDPQIHCNVLFIYF